MPTPFADTSFLISLYGRDANTTRAKGAIRHLSSPIAITSLGRFEFVNAVHFASFRKAISSGDAAIMLNAFASDLNAGRLNLAVCDFSSVLDRALSLAESHTEVGGHRGFDILHVATAVQLKAKPFMSFDENQRRLAKAMRLEVLP
jgi:predicted nucleic acid-binding protein